ncbi:hypothetical protein D770_00265 [Flammeovirgaceae bacterium 311]|nr:hypothetical protein D770_00265 [Flammeovirgaceae bacterium 311]
MKREESPWLKPELLDLPHGLMLFAQTALHRLEGGLHQSRSSGEEQEFSQYRAYQPGDDLRLLDWKLYARSKRLYVRQAEVPRQMQVLLLLDASASMQHRSGGWSKINYAKALAAALGLLAHRQNDVPGLQILSDQQERQLLFRRSRHHLQEYIQLLKITGAGGKWPERLPAAMLQQARSAGLVLLITDLWEEEEELKTSLSQLLGSGQDLRVLHLIAPEEQEPQQLANGMILQDLETGKKVQLRSGSDKRASADAFTVWQEGWKNWLQRRGIGYMPLSIGQEPLAVLRAYLGNKGNQAPW